MNPRRKSFAFMSFSCFASFFEEGQHRENRFEEFDCCASAIGTPAARQKGRKESKMCLIPSRVLAFQFQLTD